MVSTIFGDGNKATSKSKEEMKEDNTFRFKVSLSEDAYKTKEETGAAIASGKEGKAKRKQLGIRYKISFREQEVTVEQLLELVLEGYTFCPLFSNFEPNKGKTTYVRKNGSFTLSGKADRFFNGSYIVGIDIDNTAYEDAKDFVSRLPFQPTFWYTTLSNLTKDKNEDGKMDARFRIMFVFDQKIDDKYFFRYVSSVVHHQVEDAVKETIDDKCGMRCSQYFNGTNLDDSNIICDFGISNIIYSLPDFQISDSGYLDFLNRKCEYKSSSLKPQIRRDIKERICKLLSHSNISIEETRQRTTTKPQQENTKTCIYEAWDKTLQCNYISDEDFDSRLVKSALSLSFKEFRRKNGYFHPYVYRKERNDDWEMCGEIKYQRCDEDFLELPWLNKKVGIGERRHTRLFFRSILRRIIEPTLTPTDLLFNLICDREWFCDNSDGELGMSTLKQIVKDSFLYDATDLKDVYHDAYTSAKEKCSKRKFIIHWTCKDKIRANSLEKELRWRFLDDVYDRNLSVAENLKILKDNDCGEDVGFTRSTLYRYCKDRGISGSKVKQANKIELFRQLHKDGMSLREEVAYLAENGLKASAPTISKWIKMLKDEESEQAA